MKETLNTARVGLFLLLGLALLFIVFQTLNTGNIFGDRGYILEAQFSNLQQLKEGDDVRLAGVKIGSVQATYLERGRAFARLVIYYDVEIPDDSGARIILSGLLGTNLIEVEYGQSSTYLSDGDRIQTLPSTDLNQILSQVGDLGDRVDDFFEELGKTISSFSGDEDSPGLFVNLNELITENRESIKQTAANLERITDMLARGEGTIGRLLSNDEVYESIQRITGDFETVAANAARFSSEIEGMVNQLQSLVTKIDQGEGTIGRLLNDDTIAREIEIVAKNIRELTDKINAGEGTLGRLLADDELYQEATALMRKAETTLDGLGNQGPITAVGIAASALF